MIYKRKMHWHMDVTINGARYREALNTTDKREAKELEKNRIAEIKHGKGASKTGRAFARKPFNEAADVYLDERQPHNADAMAALSRLRQRAEGLGTAEPEHFVFPACERLQIDPTRPQKTWRTAWRSLVRETATEAGRRAAKAVLTSGQRLGRAKTAYRKAAVPFRGLRFHDLRHQAITELAEGGASDATIEALAGHMSREMLEHYSHVRMAAKRAALEKLSTGLMKAAEEPKLVSVGVN